MENRFKPSTPYRLHLSRTQKELFPDHNFTTAESLHFTLVSDQMYGAFVVQIKTGSEQGGPIQGRVEHVRSGNMTHFENAGQLIEFLIRSLQGEASEEAERAGRNGNSSFPPFRR